jgi:hypothetical protein
VSTRASAKPHNRIGYLRCTHRPHSRAIALGLSQGIVNSNHAANLHAGILPRRQLAHRPPERSARRNQSRHNAIGIAREYPRRLPTGHRGRHIPSPLGNPNQRDHRRSMGVSRRSWPSCSKSKRVVLQIRVDSRSLVIIHVVEGAARFIRPVGLKVLRPALERNLLNKHRLKSVGLGSVLWTAQICTNRRYRILRITQRLPVALRMVPIAFHLWPMPSLPIQEGEHLVAVSILASVSDFQQRSERACLEKLRNARPSLIDIVFAGKGNSNKPSLFTTKSAERYLSRSPSLNSPRLRS